MNDNVIRDSNVIGIRAVVLKLQLRHFAWPITVHHCWSLGAYTTTPQPIPALIQPFHDRLKATREWPNLALLAYSSLLLALSSEKSPFRGFILQLVFPMFIYDDLDFFFFFAFFHEAYIELRSTAKWFCILVPVMWQKCKDMQSSLHEKGTVEHPGAWAPVIVSGAPAEFSIELGQWERTIKSYWMYWIDSDPWNNTSHKRSLTIYILPYIFNAGQGEME